MPEIAPKFPGLLLEEKIKERNLTQAQAAQRIGITRQYLNGIINGKYPFTADLGLKLAEPLGAPPEFWAEAVQAHDRYLATDEGRELRRAKDLEALLLDFELHGVRTLVDHHIEAALQADYLRILPPPPRERILASQMQLTFGLKGFHYDSQGRLTTLATKPSLTLRRGESLSINTHEKIIIPARLRGRVLGLSETLADQFLTWSCPTVLDHPFSNHLKLTLTNHGPLEVRIAQGEPCLMLGFEFFAQEPLASGSS